MAQDAYYRSSFDRTPPKGALGLPTPQCASSYGVGSLSEFHSIFSTPVECAECPRSFESIQQRRTMHHELLRGLE
ncbi:hypothetical protein DdX_20192 [Ditylenchus destructor]|uniref:Uncharacterized protein n=1 Tax=Ditylenchus destructor TaxID=166010 RepID=A0AAD4MJ39_9BILA|nr:hypothetical protein DdX_20192 [Ditylenchus destructor]